jgi:tetrahydromethanopterin S-methyltransferase subunit G
MDDFDKFDKKLDKLDSRLDNIDITLVKHEENLKRHMQRSDNSEKMLTMIVSELKPIRKHVVIAQFVGKILAWFFGSGLLLFIIEKLIR